MKVRAAIPAHLFALGLLFTLSPLVHAQRGGRGGAPLTPKAAAPIDLTGYWVSIVTEDWRYRMMTPAKGDFPGIPLNSEGVKAANEWDPAKDEAGGNQCRAYGAGAIMRMPGRLHIGWQDDNTLKVEMDNGEQTRLFYFNGAPQTGEASWQGDSLAQWEFAGGRANRRGGDLKVVTTRLKPGYLQKNGVPYSANAVITEHFDLTNESDGTSWLIVTTLADDPRYLTRGFQRSTHFRKQADNKGWDPTPCTAR
ncbi:MAG TPA: hypothetical protein VHY84_16960 [Bryobacteraceae bacterium]|jgi:hypothetical protein|nr:hypothetical protein [Bryobacteraceae bacterium]